MRCTCALAKAGQCRRTRIANKKKKIKRSAATGRKSAPSFEPPRRPGLAFPSRVGVRPDRSEKKKDVKWRRTTPDALRAKQRGKRTRFRFVQGEDEATTICADLALALTLPAVTSRKETVGGTGQQKQLESATASAWCPVGG